MSDDLFTYPEPEPERLGSASHVTASGEEVAKVWAEKQGQTLPSEQEQYVQLFMHQIKGAVRIPAGTEPVACRKCPELLYFVGRQPVSVKKYKEQPEGIAPTETDDGCGISHWANCPKANEFREERGRR